MGVWGFGFRFSWVLGVCFVFWELGFILGVAFRIFSFWVCGESFVFILGFGGLSAGLVGLCGCLWVVGVGLFFWFCLSCVG